MEWIQNLGLNEQTIGPVLALTFSCAFFAILFLQSGIDKVTDRKGNLEWLTGHFANSPLKNVVPLMLSVVTLLEIATGAVCGLGLLGPFVRPVRPIALIGLTLACVSLLMLFFGQRVAKDYPGASTLAIYFGVALVSLGMCPAAASWLWPR